MAPLCALILSAAPVVADNVCDDLWFSRNHLFDRAGYQYVQLNAEFHRLLAKFPASPLIEREIERMSLLPLASPSAFLSDQALVPDFTASLQVAQSQHRAILDAIVRREGARAEALAPEHARLALMNFNHLTQTRPVSIKAVPGLALVASS